MKERKNEIYMLTSETWIRDTLFWKEKKSG
jgi:hypothetical protein